MPGNPTLTAFAASPPPWSLASMDTNFTNIANLLKNANNYSLYLGDTGSANAYAVAFPAGITWSLTNGGVVIVNPANANTTASTLAVNSGTAKNLFMNGAALVGGEIKAGVPFTAVYDGTQFNIVGASRGMTMQVLTAGSAATYTTPAGCKAILVCATGAGGGGAGTGTASATAGGTGGTTIFNSVNANGGAGGAIVTVSSGAGGTGGTGTATFRLSGTPGGMGGIIFTSGTNIVISSGQGGGRGAGKAGGSGAAGAAGVVNTGGGGASGPTADAAFATINATWAWGGGGGEGEYFELLIRGPAATYTYTIGAAGTAGAAGTSGFAGGIGGTGVIRVYEFY